MSGTDASDPEAEPALPPLDYSNASEAPAPPPRRSPWGKVLLVTIAVAVLVMVLMPAPGRAREGAQRVKCMSNLRELSLALQAYAGGNRGRFPDRLEPLVLDGSVVPQTCFCPNVADDDGKTVTGGTPKQVALQLAAARVSYIYVGKGLGTNSAPDVVILYELPGHHPVSRYKVTRPEDAKKGSHVLFADGWVVFVPEAAMATMVQQLNAGQNPPPAATPYSEKFLGMTVPTDP
jgi:hypothetical protein